MRLEVLEQRTLPTVTAVNESFTTTPNTSTALDVLAQDTAASNEPVSLLSVGAVSPSGPTLTRNADGSLTFTSAAAGAFTFSQTVTGAQQDVIASDGATNDYFGQSVAISGNTAVIGASYHQGQGAAYVFTLSGSTWSLQQELTATGGQFGYSVALGGHTLVVGAAGYFAGGPGAAYVYTFSGSTWSLQQELTADDGANGDFFGGSVAVSGATVVVGASLHQGGSNTRQGAAYVYTFSGSTWSQQAELTAADGAAGDDFGYNVAISGNTAVVGAAYHQVGSNPGQGAAYVYTFSGTTWSQQQELTAADGAAHDQFGDGAVAIEGNTIVVGAFNRNAEHGVAYVYVLSGTTWSQQQELTAADGAAGDGFGGNVMISGDTLVVGAPGKQVGSNAQQGAAYVYTLSGSTWSQQQELTAADGLANAFFGGFLAFSGDTVVVGAPGQTVGSNTDRGTVYIQNVSTSSALVTVNVTTPAVIAATSGGGQSTTVNTAFANPLIATVTDAHNNPVPGITVTFAAAGSSAGVTFPGGNTAVTNAQGQASIAVTANTSAGPCTVTASVSGVATPARFALTNNPGAAAAVAFRVQPSNTPAGAPINPAVQVQVVDRFGNLVSSDSSDQVTLSVASGPGSFTAGSITTATVSGGVATFTNLVLDSAGPYILGESGSGGLGGSNSGSFTVRAAAADHLAFGVQPTSTATGTAISPAVQVQVLDQYGNLESSDSSDQVTLSVASGPGGFTSGSTTMATVSGGVATFANLVLDSAGSYTLGESGSGGLSGSNSGSFTVRVPVADHLVFSVQPAGTSAGAAISPAVRVEVLDQFGNVLSSDSSDQVTLSVASGPGGFTSGSTTTVTVSAGVASFANLVLDSAGSFTLGASATGGLSGPHSTSFTISPLAADHLTFAVGPGDTVAGAALSPAVKVQVVDTFGNLLTADSTDRIAMSVNGGSGFASGSTTTMTVQNGVAAFSNLILTAAGSYTLSARSSSGLASPSSSSFTVNPQAPDHLAFLVQPADTSAGVALHPAVQVQVLDRYGNPETTDNTDQVTVSLASGPGGFTSGSTTTATVSKGVASFANLVLDTTGTYTLGASGSGGLVSPGSNSFTVFPGVADHLAFAQQPAGTTAGVAIRPVVQVLDHFGNVVTGDFTDQVTVSVASGPGDFTAGTPRTATASAGVAILANLVLDTAGTYTLAVSGSGGLSGSTSASFVVAPGALDHLTFGVPPGDAVAGQILAPAVTVRLFDVFDNPLTNDNSDPVTLKVASGPGSLGSGSTATVPVQGGVATFRNVLLTKAGRYTLAAGSGGLVTPASSPFTVSAAAADHLAFVQQPGLASAGQVFASPVQVAVEDAFGNVVLGDNSSVTLSLGSNPGGASLGGTLPQTAVNGVAIFADLSVSGGGAGFTLQASDGTLTPVTSTPFTVGQVTLLDSSIMEFRPLGTLVGSLALNEGGSGHVVHYALVTGPGSEGNAFFTISGNHLLSGDAFDRAAHPRYSVRVRATDEAGQSFEQVFTIHVLADPHLVRSGKVLTVSGTKRADTFSFTTGRLRDSLSLNGVSLAVDVASVSTVVFQGGGGSDSATLNAGAGNSTLSLAPGKGTLSGKGYTVQLIGVAHVVVNAGRGKTKATLAGGAEADSFSGTPKQATLSGRGLNFAVNGFQAVTASGGGGNDSATLHGGPTSNTFTGSGKSAVLAGATYSLGLSGFRKVTAYATAGAVNKKSVHAVDYVFVALGKWS